MKLFEKLLIAALLIGMAGCARGPVVTKPRPGTMNSKPTVAMHEYASRLQFQNSGYYREFEDATREYPVFLVISSDRTACIVSSAVWALWHQNDVVVCSDRWRFFRSF